MDAGVPHRYGHSDPCAEPSMEDILDFHGNGRSYWNTARFVANPHWQNFAFIPAIYFLFPETKGLRGVGIWKWATSETQGCSLFDAFIAHRDRGNEDSLLQARLPQEHTLTFLTYP